MPGRRLVERWSLSYAASEAQHAQQGRSSASRLEPAAVYKRMVIAMRSLFSYVRVLPSYRLYKACAVSNLPTANTNFCPMCSSTIQYPVGEVAFDSFVERYSLLMHR